MTLPEPHPMSVMLVGGMYGAFGVWVADVRRSRGKARSALAYAVVIALWPFFHDWRSTIV